MCGPAWDSYLLHTCMQHGNSSSTTCICAGAHAHVHSATHSALAARAVQLHAPAAAGLGILVVMMEGIHRTCGRGEEDGEVADAERCMVQAAAAWQALM